MIDGPAIDALIIGLAVLLTIVAGISLAVGVYLSALDMWREYHRKRERAKRPGYLDVTPDRTRLGIDRDRRR